MGQINFKKLKIRTASAVVFALLTLFIVVYGGWPFLGFVSLIALVGIYEWVQVVLKTRRKWLYLLIGPLYISMAFAYCYAIRMIFPLPVAFLFLTLVWASDVGAYFVGKIIGGPRMAQEISPNKTWAGFAGATGFPAVLFALWLVAADIHHDTVSFTLFSYLSAMGAGAALGMVGQAGDLIVSAVKRQANVKDTGNIVPGHGGILDRVDSMMLMAPVFVLFMNGFMHGAG